MRTDRTLGEKLQRAVETSEIVRILRGLGLTQREIATACAVSERSVRNWERESGIRNGHDERLRELRSIVLVLQETLTPRGVAQWLRARNRLLGNRRPLDLLAEGGSQRVLEAAESYAEGAYV